MPRPKGRSSLARVLRDSAEGPPPFGGAASNIGMN
jgi:hypothetical protein